MLSKKLMLALLLVPVVLPQAAWAQDEEEEEEEDRPRKRSSADDEEEEEAAPKEETARIREIARGVYTKAGVGGAIYPISQVISAGTFVGISVGQDFVDRETQSMAWEIAFQQGLHNGVDILTQAQNGCTVVGTGPLPCTQGDLRTYSLAVNYEISFYPARRWGIGARIGGGAMYSPLFIYPEYYTTDIVPDIGADPAIHNSIHPFVMAGPTLEYYTKLSHFSVGIDADVFYAFNWDLGINASVALKYTF
jgi:hypothetical protein